MTRNSTASPRGLLICNGAYDKRLAGGDFHFLRLAQRLIARGHQLTLLGGHALAHRRDTWALKAEVLLTDDHLPDVSEQDRLGILRDYAGKARRSTAVLKDAPEFDYAYAVSDSWADTIPLLACRAKRRALILHMRAPALLDCLRPQSLFPGEHRLASIHYALSQAYSLRRARRARVNHIFCIRPAFIEGLVQRGFAREQCSWMPVGYDPAVIDAARPASPRCDVVWVGRAHPQKGTADLLRALAALKSRIPDFKAVLIGNLRDTLGPEITALGLDGHVALPGYVSGVEKFSLVKSARVFLLPSYYEGAPAVAGEAVLCGVPVVAYAIEALAEMPDALVHRVPCFDVAQLTERAATLIAASRAGTLTVPEDAVRAFRDANDLVAAERAMLRFVEAPPRQALRR